VVVDTLASGLVGVFVSFSCFWWFGEKGKVGGREGGRGG
jgi:hypothetical protein